MNLKNINKTFGARTLFRPDFQGSFWRSSGAQNGSCGILSESSRSLLSNDIRFALIGVQTEELWLPKVRVSELFFSHFSGEDSGQTGEATGEPRIASCSWSCSLSYASELVDQIVVSRKESTREGGCPGGKTRQIFSALSLFFVCVRAHRWKACATLSLKVLDLRETELELERYGPVNRGHRSVFGPP